MAVVDKRTEVNRATTGLQTAQDKLARARFEEKKVRDECVGLVDYLKTVRNGGTSAEQSEQLRLTKKLTELVESTRSAMVHVQDRQNALDQANSDLTYAQSQHRHILDERMELAERIARLPAD